MKNRTNGLWPDRFSHIYMRRRWINVRTKFIYIYYFFDLFGDKTYTFQKPDFLQKKQPKVKIFIVSAFFVDVFAKIFFRKSLCRCIYENCEDYKKPNKWTPAGPLQLLKKFFSMIFVNTQFDIKEKKILRRAINQ